MKYWAFISYSHRDRNWGDWLHQCLETYPIPKNLVGRGTDRGYEIPKRLFPVFRDREELPTSVDLGEQINGALEQSRYLIVICSPHSAQSQWVNEEILSFRRLGRSNRILALIVDGEPNASDQPGRESLECFPEALRFELGENGELSETRTEPIAADARPQGDGKDNAKLKLAAGLLGLGFDDLKQREQERRYRQMRQIAALTSSLLLLFIALGVALYFQRNYARSQEDLAQARLSQSDFLQATERLEAGQGSLALAHLARAIRQSQHLGAGRRAGFALLQRPWARPAAPSFTSPEQFNNAELSQDGMLIATSNLQSQVQLWDALTSAPTGAPVSLRFPVQRLQFSPNGSYLIAACGSYASEDGYGLLLQADTGQPAHEEWSAGDWTGRLAFSPDSRLLAACSKDGKARIWNLESGRRQGPDLDHGEQPVHYLSFSQNGNHLLTLAADHTLRLWRSADGTLLKAPLSLPSNSQDCRFVRQDREVFFRVESELQSLEIESWSKTRPSHRFPFFILDYELDPTGTFLFVAGGVESGSISYSTGHVVRQNLNTGERVELLHVSQAAALQIDLTPDGHRLFVSTTDGDTHLVSVDGSGTTCTLPGNPGSLAQPCEDARHLLTMSDRGQIQMHRLLTRTSEPVPLPNSESLEWARFSPRGDFLITAGMDFTLQRRDPISGSPQGEPMKHSRLVSAIAFHPRNDEMASLCASPFQEGEALLQRWDLSTGKTLTAPRKIDRTAASVHYSSQSSFLVTAPRLNDSLFPGGVVQIWSPQGDPVADAIRPEGGFFSLALHPLADTLAIGSAVGKVTFWDLKSGRQLDQVDAGTGEPVTVQFSADGSEFFALPYLGSELTTWDRASLQPRHRFESILGVSHASYSPAEGRLAIAFGDENLGLGHGRIFDGVSGQPLTPKLPEHDASPLRSLLFTPDGSSLLTWASDGMVASWDPGSGRRLCDPFLNRAGPLEFAPQFNTSATRLVLPDEKGASLWSCPPLGAPPLWLADLLELLGGLELGPNGIPRPPGQPYRRWEILLETLDAQPESDPWTALARWRLTEEE